MTKKIKEYFSREANVSKFVFSLVIIGVFSLVFGQAVYANFVRTENSGAPKGTDGLGFAYGYGFGTGYGWGYGYGTVALAGYGHTVSPTPDGAPTTLTATPSQTSFTVDATTSYLAEVKMDVVGQTGGTYETAFATDHPLSATGLTCNTLYNFTVYAKDIAGNTYSDVGSVTTSACTVTSGSRGSHSSGPATDMGCSAGNLFSTQTGKICVNNSSTGMGCSAGNLFNTQTGQPCLNNSSVPGGCSAGNIYNTATGARCTNNTTNITNNTTNNITNNTTTARLFTRDLYLGITDSQVKLLQQFLNAHGFPPALTGAGSSGNETTYFGRLTKAAVMKYQKAKGIKPVAGYFGPLTRGVANREQ